MLSPHSRKVQATVCSLKEWTIDTLLYTTMFSSYLGIPYSSMLITIGA